MISNVTGELGRWIRWPAWFRVFALAVGASLLVLIANAWLGRVEASSWWGIAYGILAGALMLAAAAYGWRRRSLDRDVGRSRTWLGVHVYGGALFVWLMFLHTGFSLPSGALNWTLWILALVVGLSGFVGVALQRVLPRMLNSGLSIEVPHDRVPELVDELRDRAEELAAASPPQVTSFFEETLREEMHRPQRRAVYFLDITGGTRRRARQFAYLRDVLGDEDRERLSGIETAYRTKLELDAHYTLQWALRVWLYAHVPASVVLLVLLFAHIFVIVRY